MSITDAPLQRAQTSGVWIGSRFVILGGMRTESGWMLSTGGAYVSGYVDADHDGSAACTADCDDGNSAIHPGAPELCNGIDDDCAAAVDDLDSDGDGFFCPGDCNNGNATVWSTPSEALSLILDKSGTSALGSWSPPALPGGTSPRYDALASAAASFDTRSCVATDVATPAFDDAVVPVVGTVRHYLTRARNACASGTLGIRSDGTERTAPVCP